jgi:hypothetical protein
MLFSCKEYKAVCIPPVPEDLSLTKLDVLDGRPQNAALAGRITSLIREYCESERFYAPNTSIMTANVASPRRFTGEIHLTRYLRIRNNLALPIEGTWVKPYEGVIYSTRGCPVLVFTAGSYMCVTHAGRDSLIDRHRILTGKKSRRFESVIHAVMERFRRLHIPPEAVFIHGFFGLMPQVFDHSFSDEKYALVNRRLAEELNASGRGIVVKYSDGKEKLVLGELVRLHAISLGVPAIQVEYNYRLPVNGLFSCRNTDPVSNLVIISREPA